eukprot:RCo032116
MAKSKNHTNHNQNHKDHRNGIKRAARRKPSSLGINPQLRKNNKYSLRKNRSKSELRLINLQVLARRWVAMVRRYQKYAAGMAQSREDGRRPAPKPKAPKKGKP